MTSSALRGGRQATWTRDKILDALRRYTELYGPGWTSAAFNPSTAKWRDELWLIERYHAGDPETGAPWPSLNAIKSHFDGSFNAAREAVGLPPNKPGGGPRRRQGEHAPVRDVSHPRQTVYITDDREIARLQKALDRALARLEKAEANLARRYSAPRPMVPAKTKIKTVKVVDDAAVERARSRAERMVERSDDRAETAKQAEIVARGRADEASRMATKLASKLERSEATITSLREERRELAGEARRAGVAEDVARSELDTAREEIARLRNAQRVIVKNAPEQDIIDAALAEARDARRSSHSSEVRAAEAERAYREVAAAATGEARRLSRAELDGLRASSPAGPALVAGALKELAKARKADNPVALNAALRKLAAAAVSWGERL